MAIVVTVRTNDPTIRLERDGSDICGKAIDGKKPKRITNTRIVHPLASRSTIGDGWLNKRGESWEKEATISSVVGDFTIEQVLF